MLREGAGWLRYLRDMSRASPSGRSDRLDALRGAAMVWMTAFHFAFDLNQFHLIPRQNFYADPFWTGQRLAIVTLFLGCAGVAQALARQPGAAAPPGRFWRRWAQVAGCAVGVSLGSAWMFPRSWISFGVLHAVAALLLILHAVERRVVSGERAEAWRGWLAAGAVALLLPQVVAHPVFDSRWTWWVGLVTHKPVTEDFVPLLPWFGVFAWGYAAGLWLTRHRPQWLAGALARPLQPLTRLGRWSLSYYMVHQPVLIGALLVLSGLTGR
jgi:uncharacterized membrane protein